MNNGDHRLRDALQVIWDRYDEGSTEAAIILAIFAFGAGVIVMGVLAAVVLAFTW